MICLDKEYNFKHKCCTKGGSSGSPILNKDNKLIGIHKEGNENNNCNIGTFLNFPIKEFINLEKKKNHEKKINIINNKTNKEFLEDNQNRINHPKVVLRRKNFFFHKEESINTDIQEKFNKNSDKKNNNTKRINNLGNRKNKEFNLLSNRINIKKEKKI